MAKKTAKKAAKTKVSSASRPAAAKRAVTKLSFDSAILVKRLLADVPDRAREVLEYIHESLARAGVLNLLPAGAVLTGGGSLLDGMTDLTEDTLGMRARTASPLRIKGEVKPVQKPQYATSVGLLYFSARNDDPRPKGKGAATYSFGSIVEAVKGWFRGK